MGYETTTFPEDALFLVTGGAGFIGSNLCEALLKKGVRVRCLDDLSTGKYAHVELFLGNPRYEFIKGDVKELDVCVDACRGVDYVLHHAAWGSVPSSSSVYGDEPNLPKFEGREGALLSPYALTKRCDEEWAKQYTLHYGLATIGLRYFNVFGRRQNPDGAYAAVIPRFIRQILKGERPTINGDGRQSRDFTYVENVVEANFKACLAPAEASGEVFNVAFGESSVLIDVYRTITKALGREIEPIFGPDRPGDVRHSLADIGKARRLLGYSPDYSFDQGLVEAIEWYKNNLS